jgi:hypothetical protein
MDQTKKQTEKNKSPLSSTASSFARDPDPAARLSLANSRRSRPRRILARIKRTGHGHRRYAGWEQLESGLGAGVEVAVSVGEHLVGAGGARCVDREEHDRDR